MQNRCIIYNTLGDNNSMLSDKKKIYNIILDKQTKEKIDEIAKAEDRSSSAMINWILKKYIEQMNKENQD
jgi:predicted DNA-binding protein